MTTWTDANGVTYTLEPEEVGVPLCVTMSILRERGMDRDAAWDAALDAMHAFEQEQKTVTEVT